jgi:predicted deacylase
VTLHAAGAVIRRRAIKITGSSDTVQMRVPVLTVDSGIDGPVVWLTACIHGDEVGGTAIVHDVFQALRRQGLIRGAVHGMPLINSVGFENVSRFINADREDLNRCFPGTRDGSMGQRVARRLFDAILQVQPDLVIDVHNDWVHSVPYILLDPPGIFANPDAYGRALEAARATRLLLVEDTDVLSPLRNTLAGALATVGVPALTVEAGGAGRIVEANVSAGASAVLATLEKLGLTAPTGHADSTHAQPLLRYSSSPLCNSSGLIRFAVGPGETVTKRQVLARVFSAFGAREETLRAEAPGYVLGLEDHARVAPGSAVIALALQ